MKINHIVFGNSIAFVICLTTAAHDPCWKVKWSQSFCQKPCIRWETYYKRTHFTVAFRGLQSWRERHHRVCEAGDGNKSLYIEHWQLPFEEHEPTWDTTPDKWIQKEELSLAKSQFVPYKTYAFRVVMEMSHHEYEQRPSNAQIRHPRIKSFATTFKIPPDTAQSTAFTYLQPGCGEDEVPAMIQGTLVRECVDISAGNNEGTNLHLQMLFLGIAMVTSTNQV